MENKIASASNSRQSKRKSKRLAFESLEDRRLMATSPIQIQSAQSENRDFLVQVSNSNPSQPALRVGDRFANTTVSRQISSDGWYVIQVDAGSSISAAMSVYQAKNGVQVVAPDYRFSVQTTPNEQSYASQWGLNNNGTAGADIGAQQAWQYGTTTNVVVAVIDSGVDYTHQDLASNIWQNASEISGNGIDDDRNGYVDDVRGWDFASDDNNPMDENGHGTHVAGTIGAVGNNGIGVSGVAWGVKIMALKFMDASGSGSLSDAIQAIDYARNMGAKVINASWGGGGFSAALQQAITRFQNAGGIFVAAAGNESSNNATVAAYPANYSGVISVGASTRTDSLASFSNYGTNVDVVAPGASILSTLPGNRYGNLSGTSMASPHVAGALALLWGQNTTLSATAITNAILNNTDNVLRGSVSQYGRIDLGKAAAALKGSSSTGNGGGGSSNGSGNTSPTEPRRIYSVTAPRFLADATWRGATSTNVPIQIADDIRIEDINVNLSIAHTWLRDLSIQLISPDGTVVNLVTRRGGSGDNLIATIDDQATSSVTSISNALTVSGSFRGEQALSSLRGKSAKGQWILRVTDSERGDVGQLLKAELDILPAITTSSTKTSSKFTRTAVMPTTNIAVRAYQLGYSVIDTSTFKTSDETGQRERLRRSVDQIFSRWL